MLNVIEKSELCASLKGLQRQVIPVLHNPVSLPSNISTLITITNHQDSMVKFFTAAVPLIIDSYSRKLEMSKMFRLTQVYRQAM